MHRGWLQGLLKFGVVIAVLAIVATRTSVAFGASETPLASREAVAGVFDASGYEPRRDGALALRGEWIALWGVQPDVHGAIDESGPRSVFRMPEPVGAQAPPGEWTNGQGMVSLALELTGLPRDQNLAIHVPTLWSSALRCRSAEGVETVSSTSPDGDVRVVSSLAPYALELPRSERVRCILAYAVPPPVEGWRSFFPEAPELAAANTAIGRVSDNRSFFVGLCVFMVTLASYLLVQWQARPRDRAPLVVASLFVFLAAWLAGYGGAFESLTFPSFLVRRRIEFASVAFGGAAGLWSALLVLQRRPTLAHVVLGSLTAAAGVATLLAPVRLLAYVLYTFVQPTAVLAAITTLIHAAASLLARDAPRRVRVLALGTLVPSLLAVADFALARLADVRLGLTAYGMVLLGFVFALTLARVNASAHSAAEAFADRSSRFVPREFLNALGHDDLTTVRLGDARERTLAVLFADLRRFTALSEHLSPAQTFAFLNECFACLGPPIREHGGFVDKYIGDAVMALFPDDPAQAVRAALAMQKSIVDVRSPGGSAERIGLGIGVHVGSVMMGTIGDERRFEATVISDAVNLAARLEALTKQLGCSLVVSGAIADALPDDLVPQVREIGRFAVKGKSEPVTVVEVFALDAIEVRRHKFDTKVRFARAVDSFMRGDYEAASTAFGELVDRCPEDGPAHWWFLRVLREQSGDSVPSVRRFVQLDEK